MNSSNSIDPDIRNFKDFLLLYNKVTELCFLSCVDNFFSRNLGGNESACVDQCVTKFARFNQSMMNVYVEVQADINSRRIQEIEAAEAKALAAATSAATEKQSSSSTENANPSIDTSIIGDTTNASVS